MKRNTSYLYSVIAILMVFFLFVGTASAQSRKKKKQRVEVIKVDTVEIAKIPIPKAPVTPYRDTIFYIYGNTGSFTAEERAAALNERIRTIEDDYSYNENLIKLFAQLNGNINIVYKEQILESIDTVFAKSIDKSRVETARYIRNEIVDSIQKQREETSLQRVAIQGFFVLLILSIEFFILKGVRWIYRRAVAFTRLQRDKKIKGVSSFIDGDRKVYVVIFVLKIIRFVVVIISLYLCLWGIFKTFPETKPLADLLLSYVLSPLSLFLSKVKDYLPNLFSIIVIIIISWYIRKFLRSVADKVAAGSITIRGFYSDWAYPTLNIISGILFAFMFILIFPYLPASDSSVFRGVSVFAGLLISLGSTSVLGNLVAGLVITYMRPFKLGDRVKIDDCLGNVIEKTALVTRVKTTKNEVITIPNSSVMNSKTINYAQSAREYGLILYTSVTISYEVPWTKVHELLLKVAERTEYVMKKQKPFILQNALDLYFVEYQLNVYTREADKMIGIYSDLRKNIQDVFGEAGVELLSPRYQVNIMTDSKDGDEQNADSRTNLKR